MENPPSHNLNEPGEINARIEAWRAELAAQPGITPGALRELESHLLDTTAALRAQGLSDDEALLVAFHRTGPPRQIAGEFIKADPSLIWRERVFWVVIALLAYSLWGLFAEIPSGLVHYVIPIPHDNDEARKLIILDSAIRQFVRLLLTIIPTVWLMLAIARGRIPPGVQRLRALFSSRTRFTVVAFTAIGSLWLFYLSDGGLFSSFHIWDARIARIIAGWLLLALVPVGISALYAWRLRTRKPAAARILMRWSIIAACAWLALLMVELLPQVSIRLSYITTQYVVNYLAIVVWPLTLAILALCLMPTSLARTKIARS